MVAGGERGGAVGDAAQQVVEPLGVAPGEIAEDVVGDQALVAGMTDAEADAGELRADMGGDRAQAVVAGVAAAGLDPDPAGREVELVVQDDHLGGLELVELQRGADGVAGEVHVGAGLQEQHLLGAEAAFGHAPLELRAPGGEAMRRGDGVGGHEADVVALAGMFGAGIAEADEELHVDLRNGHFARETMGNIMIFIALIIVNSGFHVQGEISGRRRGPAIEPRLARSGGKISPRFPRLPVLRGGKARVTAGGGGHPT